MSTEEILKNCVEMEIKALILYRKMMELAENSELVKLNKMLKAFTIAEKAHLKMFLRMLLRRNIGDEEVENYIREYGINIDVEDIIDGLKKAIEVERNVRDYYQKNLEEAMKIKNFGLYIVLSLNVKVDENHEAVLKRALEFIENGGDFGDLQSVYVCPNCGFLSLNKRPYRCPICQEPGKNFIEVS